jgi:transposase-like protein
VNNPTVFRRDCSKPNCATTLFNQRDSARLRDNVLAKVPKNAQAEVKADYWAIFDLPEDAQPGPDAVAKAQAKIDSFATRWRDSYPAAVRCLLDDRDSLTVYLRFPREHWTRVRHSNFISNAPSARRAAGSR